MSDIKREGQFVTLSDARKPRYSNWLKGEPNNVNNEDCLLYDGMMEIVKVKQTMFVKNKNKKCVDE